MLERGFIAQIKSSLESVSKIHMGITVDHPRKRGENIQS